MNNYGIFFSYGGRVIRLPINPQELPVVYEGNNDTLNVLGIGDITIQRTPKQKQITFTSYFPARNDIEVLTRGGFEPPEFYIDFFNRALSEKRVLTYTPAKRLETGEAFDTSDSGFQCTVEAFNLTEKGGETGDFYYELTIKEWRDYSPQRVKTRTTSSGEVAATFAPARSVPAGQLTVGQRVSVNGNYYISSYGDEPHGVASNLTAVISRLVTQETRAYPVHVATESGGALGWVAKSAVIVLE